MENETAHFRNQNMIMTEINKRDTETIEKLEFEILQAQNKLQIYKNTFQHKDELIVDYKTLHNEEAKKLNRIIKE